MKNSMMKMMMVNNMRFFIFISLTLLFSSCRKHPNIKVTREYIYNSDWGVDNKASTVLWKAIPNEFIKNMDVNNLNAFELSKNIKLDTTYMYITTPHKKSTKKLFFDRENDGIHWYVGRSIEKTVDVIGQLDLDTWYALGSLYNAWEYYIYVDKEGNVHTWAVNPVNI